MLIKGKAEFIPRAKVPAPDDGVHCNGSDGLLKGSHSVMLGDKLLPKGRVGLYWKKNEETGIKVFYSLSWAKAQKMKYVKRIKRKWAKLYKLGISPKPEKIISVKIDLEYKGKKHKATAFGIKTEHVDAPEKAWIDYAKGIPYDWNADEHEDHSPEGYTKFVKRSKKIMAKKGLSIDGSWKLGDVIWSCRRKRFYLVDID